MISERYQENVTKIKIVRNAPFFVHLARQKGKQGNGYSLLYTKIQKNSEGDWRETSHGKIGFGLGQMNNKRLGVLTEYI